MRANRYPDRASQKGGMRLIPVAAVAGEVSEPRREAMRAGLMRLSFTIWCLLVYSHGVEIG